MLHRSRRWQVTPIASSAELANKLTNFTWCACNGFSLHGWLFLNDSTSADGAQEYAVVRLDADGHFRQYESVTFGWMTRERAEQWFSEWFARADFSIKRLGYTPGIVAVNEHGPGSCRHCA